MANTEDYSSWVRFCDAWYRSLGDQVVSTRKLCATIDRPDMPKGVAVWLDDAGLYKSLGRQIGKRCGIRFGQFRIANCGLGGHTRVRQWRLSLVSFSPTPQHQPENKIMQCLLSAADAAIQVVRDGGTREQVAHAIDDAIELTKLTKIAERLRSGLADIQAVSQELQ